MSVYLHNNGSGEQHYINDLINLVKFGRAFNRKHTAISHRLVETDDGRKRDGRGRRN